jgi:hypothetical protein
MTFGASRALFVALRLRDRRKYVHEYGEQYVQEYGAGARSRP